VVKLSADELERLGVEHGEQLVVGEAEPVLQERCGGGGQNTLRTRSEELVLSARSGDADD
jgi:hypothetical protein